MCWPWAGRFLETRADERACKKLSASLGTCRWLYIQRCAGLSLLGNYSLKAMLVASSLRLAPGVKIVPSYYGSPYGGGWKLFCKSLYGLVLVTEEPRLANPRVGAMSELAQPATCGAIGNHGQRTHRVFLILIVAIDGFGVLVKGTFCTVRVALRLKRETMAALGSKYLLGTSSLLLGNVEMHCSRG